MERKGYLGVKRMEVCCIYAYEDSIMKTTSIENQGRKKNKIEM
jgi:hypothetical protein